MLLCILWLLAKAGGLHMKRPPLEEAKFAVGDLVKVNNFGLLLVESGCDLGIITDGPYIFKTTTHSHTIDDLFYFEYWTYDIFVDGKLIKMMPETFLEEVDTDEENS